MSWKKIALVLLFVDFLAFTAWAVFEHGYLGFLDLFLANALGVQVLADLAIALSLVLIWMVRDARERGVSIAPYVVLTLFLGSIGPLLYLVRRPEEDAIRVARAPARA